jgi:phasin family protein
MANSNPQKIANNNANPSIKSRQATESILKGQEALTESGNASKTAVDEGISGLGDIQRLSAAKNPVEFIELQQKLIKEGVEAAVSDYRRIGQLTSAVFTAAFEPVKKQIEAAQKTAHT